MTELQTALNTIKKEIAFIERNVGRFMGYFHNKYVFDLYDISFDALHVKWVSVEDNGLHAKNERTIAEYLRWKDKMNENH